MTERKTGNAKSFQLARAIKHRRLDAADIEAVFRLWFAMSRPMLPPDADESKSLNKFFSQLQHVRFTESGLSGAMERARTGHLPDIPSLNHNEEAIKLAALHRELQREARGRPYICPIGIVVDFIPVRWRSQAGWLTHVLEEEGVIECVDRGVPNKPGMKGKPTLWRYLYPM
jgi:hypothetical protein